MEHFPPPVPLSFILEFSLFILSLKLLRHCPANHTHLALLVADGQVLAPPVGGREHTHGHATQHMGADQLADGLALVPAVVHAHVLEGALLGPQGGHLCTGRGTVW